MLGDSNRCWPFVTKIAHDLRWCSNNEVVPPLYFRDVSDINLSILKMLVISTSPFRKVSDINLSILKEVSDINLSILERLVISISLFERGY